jgi:hypothetical protein
MRGIVLDEETGVSEIVRERIYQVRVEGWTAEHDDAHVDGDLAIAAACYAMPPGRRWRRDPGPPALWPWSPGWWKPTPSDRIRELAKAGALIAAEIDRLLRFRATEIVPCAFLSFDGTDRNPLVLDIGTEEGRRDLFEHLDIAEASFDRESATVNAPAYATVTIRPLLRTVFDELPEHEGF